jgi:hypothetical protein
MLFAAAGNRVVRSVRAGRAGANERTAKITLFAAGALRQIAPL